jgi:hypothetical protein
MSITKRTPLNTNYLSHNRFKLVFPKAPHIEYFCRDLVIPEITNPAVEQVNPFSPVRVTGVNAHYPPFTMNIICDEDLVAWQEIHDWLVGTSFPHGFEEYQEVKRTGLYTDVTVLALSNANVPTIEWRFHHAFPSALGGIAFAADDTGNEFVYFPVVMSYTDYMIRRLKNP